MEKQEKPVQRTVRFPRELYQSLKAEARSRGMTLNSYLISRLWGRGDGVGRR